MDFLSYTFFESPEQYFIVAGVVLLSQFIYSTIGFGAGMVAISLFALLFGDQMVVFVPFFTLLCMTTEMTVCYRERSSLNVRRMFGFLAMLCPTMLLGVLALTKEKNFALLILLGGVIASLAVYYLILGDRKPFQFKNKLWLIIFCGTSGFLAGLYGIGGAPLVIYFSGLGMKKSEFRITIVSIFLTQNILRFLMYWMDGKVDMSIVLSSLTILPFGLVGMVVGIALHNSLSERVFRKVVSGVLFCFGMLLIVNNVRDLLL